jgi:hypothetical protein
MKKTNTDLIWILLWSGISVNRLVDYLFIVWKLIKKHGKLLYTEKYIKEVSDIDQNIWNLIFILKKTNKISYFDIKNLIYTLKQNSYDYNSEFIVKSDSKDHNDKIISHLNTKFKNSDINSDIIDHIWIDVSGEWRYYKKDLDWDLNKILGI